MCMKCLTRRGSKGAACLFFSCLDTNVFVAAASRPRLVQTEGISYTRLGLELIKPARRVPEFSDIRAQAIEH